MDRFGLTEEEKQTNLQNYNHALFRNMMAFLDMEWEINMQTKTVVVLDDRYEPERNNKEFAYDAIFEDYLKRYIVEDEQQLFRDHLSFEKLKALAGEVSFGMHLKRLSGEVELHNFVLTPAFDEEHRLYCVYLGARNLQAEVRRELEEYHRQQQFLNALLSHSYYHVSFDLFGDGMITEETLTKNGLNLVKALLNKPLPAPFEDLIDVWFEAYTPELDTEGGRELFSIENLREAYASGERLLELQVKQKVRDGAGMDSIMQLFIAMVTEPQKETVYAYVIWMDISLFQKETIRDNMELRSRNEDLTRSLSQEQQYRLACLSGALLIYDINLTKNRIEEEFYEIVDGRRIPMLELVGLTPPCDFDEFVRRWSESKVAKESQETFVKLFNRQYMLDCYEKGERYLEIEFDTVLGRGILVTLRNTAFLVEDEETGDILAMVNSKDVSAQRAEEKRQRETLRDAYEAANSASSAKTDFLARMSHDIRTPMNAIIGMTAIASRHLGNDDRVAECLKEISVSGKYLLALLSEVLDMSKIESGKMELAYAEFDLGVLIDNICTICRFQCKEKEHTFTVSGDALKDKRVVGDPQRLQQVLMNLLDNAIKYTMPGGKLDLKISEKETERKDVACYEFVVSDNGIGMGEDYRAHLFEPFVRSEDKRVAKIQGSGLGLPIAKSIVQMMDGTIEVESEVDRGTAVTVTVFLTLAQDAKLQESDSAAGAESEEERLMAALKEKDFGDKRVLVVEDNNSNAQIAQEILEMTGVKVEHAWDGGEAVSRIREAADGYYDLIFMDIQMPTMNGYEATRKIRAMEREYAKTVPILAMSADAFTEDVSQSKACGMNDHLPKPIAFKRLAESLIKYLS